MADFVMEEQTPPSPPMLDYDVVRKTPVDWIALLAWVLPLFVLFPLGVGLLYMTLFSGGGFSDSFFFLITCEVTFIAAGLYFPLAKLARPRRPIARPTSEQKEPLQWAGPDGKLSVLERIRDRN